MGRESNYSRALTPRELELLKLACKGFSNQEIADQLFIDIKTVEHHLHSTYGKLGASTQRQLIAKAYELCLVLPPSPVPHLEEILQRTHNLSKELEQIIDALKEIYR